MRTRKGSCCDYRCRFSMPPFSCTVTDSGLHSDNVCSLSIEPVVIDKRARRSELESNAPQTHHPPGESLFALVRGISITAVIRCERFLGSDRGSLVTVKAPA